MATLGTQCIEGNLITCQRVPERDFRGMVPPIIAQFEARVMATHFPGQSLDAWESHERYHAYLNWGALCSTSAANLSEAYTEYRHWPAPTRSGRRESPVQELETSFAYAEVDSLTFPSGMVPRIPMPGGYVTHYVQPNAHALANATQRAHALNPGYVIRWISVLGPAIMSTSLGRGIGWFQDLNTVYGVRMFYDLDQRIKQRLER